MLRYLRGTLPQTDVRGGKLLYSTKKEKKREKKIILSKGQAKFYLLVDILHC